jgi:alkanesulfonate monooxygenase SsuD/methylene tetrahydromethanopterin reductase-like flavin-dependent oxidoreductase (luciferase family)
MSDAAIRRAARHGDAWFPSMLLPEQVGPAGRRLSDLAAAWGRPAPAIAMGGMVALGPGVPPSAVEDVASNLTRSYGVPAGAAPRIPIAGDVSEAAERFAAYAEAGVAHLVLGTFAGDWRRQCELIAEARALLG